MTVRRHLTAIAALLALALAACTGGSGSSGFDAFSEDAAIDRALAAQRCVSREALTICPTNAVWSSPSTPNVQEARVDIGLTEANTTCTLSPTDGCSFSLPFTAAGFASTARFHVAVRSLDPDGPWSVGPELTATSQQPAPAFDTPVAVDTGPRAPSASRRAQVAVLVFLEPREPVPTEVRELAETAADFAFVSGQLTLVAASSPPS